MRGSGRFAGRRAMSCDHELLGLCLDRTLGDELAELAESISRADFERP